MHAIQKRILQFAQGLSIEAATESTLASAMDADPAPSARSPGSICATSWELWPARDASDGCTRTRAQPVSHMCYTRRMAEVASRELRNDTRGLLRRVEAGEHVIITVDGRPVAVLGPVSGRPSWISKDEFVRRFADKQADAGLADELRQLVPDVTDDLSM